jgi:hypothetical protein
MTSLKSDENRPKSRQLRLLLEKSMILCYILKAVCRAGLMIPSKTIENTGDFCRLAVKNTSLKTFKKISKKS